MRRDDSELDSVGQALFKLLLEAGLTLDEVGARMGCEGRFRWKLAQRLENGTVRSPLVSTLGAYLRAYGAKWYQIADALDKLAEEPVDPAWLEQGGRETRVDAAAGSG